MELAEHRVGALRPVQGVGRNGPPQRERIVARAAEERGVDLRLAVVVELDLVIAGSAAHGGWQRDVQSERDAVVAAAAVEDDAVDVARRDGQRVFDGDEVFPRVDRDHVVRVGLGMPTT